MAASFQVFQFNLSKYRGF